MGWTKAELIDECKALGIDQTGLKSEIIARIKLKCSERSQSDESIKPCKNEKMSKLLCDEDCPVEDWTKAKLIDKCKTLGIDQNGTKSELIKRIKLKWSENNTADKLTELPKKENDTKYSDDEDGPVENWTKAELLDECKTLEIDQTGTKSELIE